MITGPQFRAARAFLGVDISIVARAAGLPQSAVRRAEASDHTRNLDADIMDALREAYEKIGVEFRNMADAEAVIVRRPVKDFDVDR